jgi:ATP synthase protein I
MLRPLGRPIRLVLRWQLAATALMALVAGLLAGVHGAVSGVLGGLISVCAGLVAATLASRNVQSAGGVLVGALTAEAVKIGVAVLLLWLVFVNYDAAVVGALLAAFVVTMLIFSMAFFVRDY